MSGTGVPQRGPGYVDINYEKNRRELGRNTLSPGRNADTEAPSRPAGLIVAIFRATPPGCKKGLLNRLTRPFRALPLAVPD